jgi:tetratricopeptide (TPR) repeat protein
MNESRWILLLVLLTPASTFAAFPDAATVERIFLAQIGQTYNEPEGVSTSAFVEGDTPDRALAAVRVSYGYNAEVYLTLFARDRGRWRVADVDGPIIYMADFGGDEGTVSRAQVGPWTYYTFTCTEASYGSGMGTEYDYFKLYRTEGDKLVQTFEGETGSREDYYSRWYGGDDSSAWEYGGYVQDTTAYTFEDVDGDGLFELWAYTRERPAQEGPWTYVTAELFAADKNGVFAPADLSRFREILAATSTAAAKLALAAAALTEDGDVPAARAFLEEAAALEPAVAGGISKRITFMERFADDPPDAVRLYYRGGSDDHRELIEQYPESAAAAEAVVQIGTPEELAAFLKNNRDHPRWPEAYAYAVREALYDINYEEGAGVNLKDLGRLKKDLKRYVKLTADADDRGQTLTHLADCFYHFGEFKSAARFYRESLSTSPAGIFQCYNNLRLGDCAAAANDDGAAIGYYIECVDLDDWWSGAAADSLAGYAAVREGAKWRHFLDYLDDRGSYSYLSIETGDVDGNGEADLVALVPREDEPYELYYFLRTDDGFRGELLTVGRPSLWLPKIEDVFDVGPAVLSCRETDDGENGRAAFEVLYRYDGSGMREVGRVKTEETRADQPSFEYKAVPTFADAPRPTLDVEGKIKTAEGETTFFEKYVWDEDNFAFVRAEQ